jgi:hypothetical protein
MSFLSEHASVPSWRRGVLPQVAGIAMLGWLSKSTMRHGGGHAPRVAFGPCLIVWRGCARPPTFDQTVAAPEKRAS